MLLALTTYVRVSVVHPQHLYNAWGVMQLPNGEFQDGILIVTWSFYPYKHV